ncbi:Dephospho-CoA kinase [Gossypium arboreum]|uniref:Dephospho-CoA kinase n=1 Tax=Gossypium arboreum TaxID=29729 RepID=A0A0B0NJG9_GOSAR|nr:Dephospho-CoA kinase [Gossypium arboreum]
MVVAEDAVWNSYINRATEKDAQIAADIVEEIDVENVVTANNLKEGNNYRRCEDDISLNEMDVSATQLQLSKPNQDGSTSLKKKKKISDGSEQIYISIIDAAMLLGENI